MTELEIRNKVVSTAVQYVGAKQGGPVHKQLIDIYNADKPLPRNYTVKYTDAWCATFVTAVAILCKLTAIIFKECGCGKMIELYQKAGRWMENDAYKPNSGDVIFYDWEDSGVGDNVGVPDHVGIVEKVSGNMITVIEGNYSNSVKRRTLTVNGKYIRGYGLPDYASIADGKSESNTVATKTMDELVDEVLGGLWGNGDERKKRLISAGYDYNAVQNAVNAKLSGNNTGNAKPSSGTTSAAKEVKATESAASFLKSLAGAYTVNAKDGLNIRDGAGTSKKVLVAIPNGTKVQNYGYYTNAGGVKWLYVQFSMNGVTYTGFGSSAYLKK